MFERAQGQRRRQRAGAPGRLLALGLCLAMGLWGCNDPGQGALYVLAAVSTADALTELGAAHQAATGQEVRFAFGASNDLSRQLLHGAPAHLFLSADEAQMDVVERAGKLKPGTRRALLSNTLVVLVPANPREPGPALREAADLSGVARLAVADPSSVPVGRYARAWLERQGLYEKLEQEHRLLPLLDARAVVAAVQSGAAPAGIAYRTEALRAPGVKVAFDVPPGEGPVIRYPFAELLGAPPAARAFYERVRSDQGRAVFERLGFRVLPEAGAP